MELLVLGPLALTESTADLVLGPPRVRRLLGVLALNHERFVSHSVLIEALWPEDGEPARPEKAIQDTVADLRRVLRAVPEDSRPCHIELGSARTGYRLAGLGDRTDSARFVAGTRELNARTGPRSADALDAAGELLGLWRGVPYADLGGLPMAVAERARLGELWWAVQDWRLEAASELADVAVSSEAPALLALDATRWRVWAAWMRTAATQGRIADALDVFQRARAAYAERGVDVPGELVRLEADFIHGSAQGPTGSSPPIEPPVPADAHRANGGPSFVGRSDELRLLARAERLARDGEAQFVVVSGEQGIGKTSLLRHFIAEAGDRAVVVDGACYADELEPYAPLSSIARALMSRVADDEAGLSESDMAALRRMFGSGDATERSDADEFPGRDGWQQGRAALVTLVRAAAAGRQGRPLIVAVEDVHWLRESPAEMIQSVLRRVDGLAVLFVVSARSNDATGTPVWRNVVAEATRTCHVHDIRLDGLAGEDILQLVAQHVPRALDPNDLTAWLLRTTAGHPFFVRELLRVAAAGEDSVVAVGGRLAQRFESGTIAGRIPAAIQHIVTARIGRLSPIALALLEAAAVFGPVWDPRTVARACDIPASSTEFAEALDETLMAGFIVSAGDVAMTFGHEIVRQAIAGGLTSQRRSFLHARAAMSLHERDGVPAAIALHWRLAGPHVDADRAVRSALDAARAEHLAFAFEQARARLIDFDSWPAMAEALTGPLGAELQLRIADAEGKLGQIEACKARAVAAFRLATAISDPELRRWIMTEATVRHLVYSSGGDVDRESLEMVERCLAEELPDSARALLCTRQVMHTAMWSTGAIDPRSCDGFRDAAVATGNPSLLADALIAEFLVARGLPDPARRLANAQQLVHLSTDAGIAGSHLANGLRALAISAAELGDRTLFDETVSRLDAVATDRASWAYSTDVIRWRAMAAIASGDYADAAALNEELITLTKPQPLLRLGSEVQRTFLEWRSGRAVDLDRFGLVIALAGGLAPVLTAVRGAIHLERGDRARAEADFGAVVTTELTFAKTRTPIDGLIAAAALAAEFGTIAQRSVVYDSLRPFEGQLAVSIWGEICQGSVDRGLGVLAAALGRPDEARDRLRRGRELELSFGAAAEARRTQTALDALGGLSAGGKPIGWPLRPSQPSA